MVEDVDSIGAGDVLQQLLAFLIVCCPSRPLVDECPILAVVAAVLESMAVECLLGLVAADIGHEEVVGTVWSLVRNPAAIGVGAEPSSGSSQ
jgi:hypothetical protein